MEAEEEDPRRDRALRKRSSTGMTPRHLQSARTVTRFAIVTGEMARRRRGGIVVGEQDDRDPVTKRVAETVRRALLLVGPAEHGVERLADEEPAETPAV
jgi:hypothetical protein